MTLRIFAITKPGIAALTIAVAALWTCVGMEASTRRQTNLEVAASLRKLDYLRRHTAGAPKSTPVRTHTPSTGAERPSAS